MSASISDCRCCAHARIRVGFFQKRRLTMAEKRTCGICSACCKAPPISVPGFEKRMGEWCRHCAPGIGCRIYSARPSFCRKYRCAWLDGADTKRPDRLGVVARYSMFPDTGRTLVLLEYTGGALETEPVARYRDQALREGSAVMMVPVVGTVVMWLPPQVTMARGSAIEDGRIVEAQSWPA